MRATKKRAYAFLASVTLVAAYCLFLAVPAPQLVFQDRAFPRGFRNLVLASASSQFDLSFGLQQKPQTYAASKPSQQDVCDALFRNTDTPAVGSQHSPIQIVSFFDYRCPYCRKLTNIISKVQSDEVRAIYKEWPILGESSVLAARAALAANKQGNYLPFHRRLMNSRLIPTVAYVESIAVDLGMNLPQLREDMSSTRTTEEIQNTFTLASALGFIGTPVLVVGRTVVHGEITQSQLSQLIENELHSGQHQGGFCAGEPLYHQPSR